MKPWLSKSYLHLNKDKTECIVFGAMWPNAALSGFGAQASKFKPAVKNLGITLDSSLKFDNQTYSMVKMSFFQLSPLAEVKPFLNRQDLEKAIHTFISSRLDYCNTVNAGINQSSAAASSLFFFFRDHIDFI